MRAILKDDLIINIVSKGGTVIPNPPPGVGLERLRWTGSELVDLMDLSSMWVERRHGVYVLHAAAVPGSQFVEMTYADRVNLACEDGAIRILGAGDLLQIAKRKAFDRIKKGFERESAIGRCTLSLGWDIDCRRGATLNDVQNCEILLKTLQLQGAPDDYAITGPSGENGIKGADNLWHPCSLQQFRDVVIPEMYQYGLGLYGRKWDFEQSIEDAETIEEVNAIIWS